VKAAGLFALAHRVSNEASVAVSKVPASLLGKHKVRRVEIGCAQVV
jgi:hypothetical protein